MIRRTFVVLLTLMALFVFPDHEVFAQAQDESIIVNGDEVEYLPEENKIRAKGSVLVEYKGSRLECNEILVDTETKEAVCSGNVTLVKLGNTLRGEHIYYNFETGVGQISDVRWSAPPYYGRAASCEISDKNHIHFTDGYVTTCDLEHPHYKIKTKSLELYPNKKIVASDVKMYAGKTPVMYIPAYSRSLKTKRTNISMIPGRNKKWGEFLLSSYRYEMGDKVWANLKLDYRTMLGVAEGVDVGYDTGRFGKGLAKFYYTHEVDRHREENEVGESERFRGQLRHKWVMDEYTQTFIDYHKMEDADFIKDYFYGEEYERDPSPSTFVSVVRNTPDYSTGVWMQKRVNRFFSETERLPQAKFNWRNHRIGDTDFYYMFDTQAASLVNKYANSSYDEDVSRFDALSKVFYTARIADKVSIMPFAGVRQSWYSKDKDGNQDRFRFSPVVGMDISTRFHRTFDFYKKLFGMEFNGLRHIINPIFRYEYVHEPTLPASQLAQFDSLDAITRSNKVAFELEHTFQTKRTKNDKEKVVDLARFSTTFDYLFGPRDGKRFDAVKAEMELYPSDWLTIESDTSYDANSRDFENWNFDFTLSPNREKWLFGMGTRYTKNTEHELTAEVEYQINDKWRVRAYERFDFKEVEDGVKRINRFKAQEYTITRDLHCWMLELTYSHEAEGGDSFWIVFKPKIFSNTPYSMKKSYDKLSEAKATDTAVEENPSE